jgi:hypothetical protein
MPNAISEGICRGSALTAVCLCAGLLPACGGDAAGRAPYAVEFVQTLSGTVDLPEACRSRRAESFVQLAADPHDPARLSAVYLQDGVLAAVGAASADGGRSWRRGPIREASACAGGPAERDALFNPLMARAADGTVYFGSSFGRVAVHAAADAAGDWSAGTEPGRESAEDASENMNLLPDDRVAGRVHALWTHHDYPLPEPFPLFLTTQLRTAVSDDAAQRFSEPVVAAASPLGRFIINGRLARASDGALLACHDSVAAALLLNAFTGTRTSFEVACTRSTDGVAWTTPVRAGTSQFLPLPDPDGRSTPGARDGEIGLSAKFDLATGPDGLAALVHADLGGDGRGQIRMALSSDAGRSWSASDVVLEREAAVFMPAVAIDRSGTIGLFWYDWTRDVAGDDALSTDAWFAFSQDRGASWTVRHLAGPFDLRAAHDPALSYDGGALGVYQDLVALGHGFGAAFTVGPPLSQEGPTDVWYARIAAAP